MAIKKKGRKPYKKNIKEQVSSSSKSDCVVSDNSSYKDDHTDVIEKDVNNSSIGTNELTVSQKLALSEQRRLMYERVKEFICKGAMDEIADHNKYVPFNSLSYKIEPVEDGDNIEIDQDLELLGIN